MNGVTILFVYAVIMILATVILTKKEKNVERFCVGSRSENWLMSALSIAATWIWAPALFVSTEKAYSTGWVVKMNEYYPDLMERIIRREPNAYLAALYWDSEMFGRSSRKRKEAEEGQEQRDYRQELIHLFNHMDVFFDTPHKRHVAERYSNFFMAVSAIATSADCKHIYEGLISGDPKMRAFRALYQRIYGRYISDAKKGERHG